MRLFYLLLVCLNTIFGGVFLSAKEEPCRKVLFVMTKLSIGGAEQAFVSMMNGWTIPNTQVDILLLERGGVLEERLTKNFPIISRKEAYKQSYDAAVCYGEWINLEKVLAQIQAKKKVQWIHTDILASPHLKRYKTQLAYAGIDAAVCVSDKVSVGMSQLFPRLRGRITTIYNVLNGDSIRRRAAEEKSCLPKDGICNVVTVARLCPEKAFDRAIRVHSRLNKEGIHFRWYIVGEGWLRANLERQIREYGAEGLFVLMGQKINPYPYILQADIFALPSIVEGCSVAVNEAKILGKPILVTDVGGAREQIESEVNGLIVANDEAAIYEGLKKLLLDEKLRTQFSEALRGFSYDNGPVYKKIENVLFARNESKNLAAGKKKKRAKTNG